MPSGPPAWCHALRRLPLTAVTMRSCGCVSQVLGCIGEQFTDGDEVCGVAVNVRAKGDRVEVWTRTASNEAAQVRPQSSARDSHPLKGSASVRPRPLLRCARQSSCAQPL